MDIGRIGALAGPACAAHEIDSAGVPENGEAVDDEDADDLPVLHPTRRQRM
jgi:hypothetical protein